MFVVNERAPRWSQIDRRRPLLLGTDDSHGEFVVNTVSFKPYKQIQNYEIRIMSTIIVSSVSSVSSILFTFNIGLLPSILLNIRGQDIEFK